MFKEKIIIEMKEVFKEIPFGIEHTLKVLKNVRTAIDKMPLIMPAAHIKFISGAIAAITMLTTCISGFFF